MPDDSLRDRRQRLLERSDLTGVSFCRAYAAEADDWLSGLAERASGGDPRRLALLAVGGYGRGELCPYSDLDVVLVHDGRRQVAAVADAIWYPVWDQGVHLDHSVRRTKEVLALADEDLRVALGLLDGRLVWGDPKVAEPLLAAAVSAWQARGGARHLDALSAQMTERHRTQGEVAFLLEPDLKEGHGGLRDVNVLRAIAVSAPSLAHHVDLRSLEPASDVLTAVRVELHRAAGRALDRLLLQEQDHVAAVLSYPDADALMAAVAEAGRRIAWVSDEAWRRRRFWQPGAASGRRRGRRAGRGDGAGGDGPGAPDGQVDDGVALAGGEVILAPGAPVTTDPWLPLRLAAVAAGRDLPIAQGALHRLAEGAPAPSGRWTDEGRGTLVRVLAAGKPAIDALEALDHHGLLVRVLPEWQAVRNRPQRNAYHRYTVDRHLLEAATNAAALTGTVERPDLLLVGTLLHDIGKGYPGDHTEVGMQVVREMATRLGFGPADVDTLVHMVQFHLLLPDVATRRDLADPATIDTVARAAGDVTTLRLLGALTEADSLATGPSAWGNWKAGLVAVLVERTASRLEGRESGTGERLSETQRALLDRAREAGALVVHVEAPQVVVAAPDRRGLLASAAGTLALHGLDVRSADVVGEHGMALELFTVESTRGRWPDPEALRHDLDSVLAGHLLLAERLAAKAVEYAGSRRPDSAHPVVPAVSVDNEASASSTVIELRTADEIGLLHRVTQALFDSGLDVVSARVSTTGTTVVDAFYVRRPVLDGDGPTGPAGGATKVTDPAALAAVERALLDALG